MRHSVKIIFALVCVLTGVLSHAQNILDIRTNPQNIFGIGTDDYQALGSMMANVGKSYSSKLDERLVISYKDELRSISHRLFNDGQYCRYISRNEVEEIFAARKIQAENIRTQAEDAENRGELGRAAMYHYWCIALYSSLPGDNRARIEESRDRYLSLAGYKFPSTAASNIGSKVELIYKVTGKPTSSASHIRIDKSSTEAKHTASPIVQDTADTIQERTEIPAGITLSIDSEKARKTKVSALEAERAPNAGIVSEAESDQTGTTEIHRWTGFISSGATIWQNPGIRIMGGPLYREHFGAYMAGTWNCRTAPYSYEFGKDGLLEGGGIFWGDGNRRVTDWSVTAGGIWMARKKKAFGFYGGAGYASKTITYRDIEANYALDRYHSYKGIIGEAGVIGRIGNFTMTTGLTFSQGYLQFSAGVGYIF